MQTSNELFKKVNACAQHAVDVRFNGVLVVQVDDLDLGVLLPEPVNAAYPLLYSHRIPWHVIVDDGPAELEVKTLCRGVCT